MSSASQSSNTAIDFSRIEQLKQGLADFVMSGPLKDEYKGQRQLFIDMTAPADEHEAESVLDWFMYEWIDNNGYGAIDYYLSAREDLSEEERSLLEDWEDSLNSAFEIRSISKNSLRLKDLESDDTFEVITNASLVQSPFKRGQHIIARLLPLGEQFIFSGLQFVMPDRDSAQAWLEMRNAFSEMDSPEAIESAQREQCRAFCDLFGCEEMTISSSDLKPTLQKFQNYLLTERRDPETGLTAAEVFRQEFGRELQVPDMAPIPEPLESAGEVTILCDDFDGLVLLPDYNRFCSVFQCKNPDKEVAGWQDLVWNYIKDPDIPIVAFERVAEQLPDRVEAVLRKALGDKDFSLDHLYAVLLHYKEPMEGIDLAGEEMLWDLFDGNGQNSNSESKPKKAAKAKAKASASKPAAATKSAAKKAPSRKPAQKAKAKPQAKAKTSVKAKARTTKARASKSSARKKR